MIIVAVESRRSLRQVIHLCEGAQTSSHYSPVERSESRHRFKGIDSTEEKPRTPGASCVLDRKQERQYIYDALWHDIHLVQTAARWTHRVK